MTNTITEQPTIETLEQVFDYIKLLPFVRDYTDQHPNGGIRQRKAGKGTNPTDKNKTFKPHEIEALKAGWGNFKKDVDKVMSKI